MTAPESVLRNRHTRVAKGMTKTSYRSNHRLSDIACRLSVQGTLDVLGRNRFQASAKCV